jgi:radical SAM protein with 4Fe4S-binding SPASM domain
MAEEMDLQQCLHTVKTFVDADFKHIHFLGGEPLASPHIYEVIKYAKEFDMIITINSNACLLDASARKLMIDLKVDQFAASLDGCSASVNDAIRGSGTFETAISNMELLNNLKCERNSNLETAFVFTLTKKNISELKHLPSLAKEVGVDLIVLTTFIESGQGQKNRDMFNVEFNEICESIEETVSNELLKHPIPLQIDMRPRFCQYLSAKYQMPIIYNTKNSLCCAGEDVWYLEANGDIHPCLIFQLESGKKALKNGIYSKEKINIREKHIAEIATSNYWNTFLDVKHNFDTSKISTCNDCRYLDECQPCFLDYGDYSIPIAECEWTKERENLSFQNVANSKTSISSAVSFDENNQALCLNNEPILKLEDDISLELWTLIQKRENINSIYNKMYQKYEVAEDELKFDIASFFYLLKNNGIIKMMEAKNNTKYFKRKDNLVSEEIDDEIIVFDVENGEFYEFEGIGSFIWNRIEGNNLDSIVKAVCSDYDIDNEIAVEDSLSFINDLFEKALIFQD